MSDNKRLKEAVKAIKFYSLAKTQAEIALGLGYQVSYLSDMINGRFEISEKFADKLENKYGIRKLWLLSGEGEMLVNQEEAPKHPPEEVEETDIRQMMKMMKDAMETNKELVAFNRQLMDANQKLTDQILKIANERGADKDAEDRRPHEASDRI